MVDTTNRHHFLALVAIVVGLFAVLGLLAPNIYPTYANLASMAFQMSEVGILALAIGAAFLVGGVDLSVVAVANLAAITAAELTTRLEPALGTGGLALAAAAALAVGALAGLLNGTLVARLRVHPIVITLGTLTLFTGIATGFTGGSTIFGTGSLTPFGRGLVGGVPVPFLVFAFLATMLGLLTTRSRWGFQVYLVGSSERASRFGRMAVARIQLTTYVLSGVLAATAGLIILARTNAANVNFGSSYLILAILVAVLAGVSPYGGHGRILFVLLSMAAMQQLSTGLNMALAGWDGANFAREFAWGVLLIAVLGWSQLDAGSALGRMVRQWFRRDDQPRSREIEAGDAAGDERETASSTGDRGRDRAASE